MKNILSKPGSQLIILLLLGLAFLYTLLRSCWLPVFHDEANSYYFSTFPFWDILTFRGISTNSHLLNTLLMKLSVGIFGLTEFSLRLPALLGHVLYLYAVWKICAATLPRSWRVAGVILLAFHSFMLELFSAARGYGLALGFWALGMHYFMSACASCPSKGFGRAAWMFALSALGHLAFAYVYLALVLTVWGWRTVALAGSRLFHATWVGPRRQELITVLFPGLLLLLVYAGPVSQFMADAQTQLWYGGEDGFWQDTVGSLVEMSLPGQPAGLFVALILKSFLLLTLVLSAGLVLVTSGRAGDPGGAVRPLRGLLGFLILLVMEIILLHQMIGVKFPVGRTAIYFIPWFWMIFLRAMTSFSQVSPPAAKRYETGFLAVVTILAALHFCRSLNFQDHTICPYDASTKAAIIWLNTRDRGLAHRQEETLCVNWIYLPAARFYQNLLDREGMTVKKIREGVSDCDYYLLNALPEVIRHYGLSAEWRQVRQASPEARMLVRDPWTGAVILERH